MDLESSNQPEKEKKQKWSVGRWSISRLFRWIAFLVLAWWLIKNAHADLSVNKLITQYSYQDSRFIDVSGITAHCRIIGKGAPVVLLHDAQSSLHTWTGWLDSLRGDYQVICVDLPGFGLTGPHPRGSYSAFMYVEFLDSLAQKLQLNRFHLVGNGLGAQIAWQFAAEKPQKVNKLILMNAPGYEKKEHSWVNLLAATPVVNRIMWTVTPKSLIRIFLEEIYADDAMVSKSLVQRHHDLLLRPGNRKAFTDRASVRDNRPPVSELVKKITAPTLIIWGAEDALISPQHAYEFHQQVPRSDLRIYPNTGHWPQEENPSQTVSDVKAFLEDRF
ncbi:MAG: alpha/beta hydrolase [Saprospiraceae bacterium]|nr:alpha/beta hydrolase [Saprospiraceae bacterium]